MLGMASSLHFAGGIDALVGAGLPVFHFGLEGFVGLALYVAAIAFFLLALWKPQLGIYFLIPLLPMQTIRYRLHEFPLGGRLIDLMLLSVIIGLALNGRLREIWETPLRNALIVLTIFYTISYFGGSLYIGASLIPSLDDPRFSDFKNYLEMMWMTTVIIAAISNRRRMALLFLFMAFSTMAVNKSFYNNMSDRDISHFNDDARESGVLGYAGENGLGAYEAQMSVFFLGLLPILKKRWQKLGILLVIGLSVYCLLFSFSRGAYLGLAAGMLFLGFTRQRKLLLLMLLVAIGWETVVPNAVRERIGMTYQPGDFAQQGRFDDSAEERLTLWDDALETVRSRPVTGTGFFTYSIMHSKSTYHDTHNYYMKTLVETGIIGMLLFVWFMGKMFRFGYSLRREASDPFLSAVGHGFAAMIVCATVVNFFGDRWTYIQINGFLWALLAMVTRGRMMVAEETEAIEARSQMALATAGGQEMTLGMNDYEDLMNADGGELPTEYGGGSL